MISFTSGLRERFRLRLRGAVGGLEADGALLGGVVGEKVFKIDGREWAAPRPRMVAVRVSSSLPKTETELCGRRTSLILDVAQDFSGLDVGGGKDTLGDELEDVGSDRKLINVGLWMPDLS